MTSPLVLVAYASNNGGTAEIAQWIGEGLTCTGVEAEVRPVSAVEDLRGYTAVVLGSGVYAGRWLRAAVRFARRNRADLLEVPVWLFSSGPLDASAAERDIAPVSGAQAVADSVEARGHATFGGRLVPGAKGFVARMILSQGKGGDFRDRAAIDAWAEGIGTEVASLPQPI